MRGDLIETFKIFNGISNFSLNWKFTDKCNTMDPRHGSIVLDVCMSYGGLLSGCMKIYIYIYIYTCVYVCRCIYDVCNNNEE